MPGPGAPRLWRRARRVAREQGVRGVVAAVLAHAGYRRLIVFERSLVAWPPPLELPPGASVERIDETTIGEYLALRPDTPEREVRAWIAAGHLGHAIRAQGRYVATGWTGGGQRHIAYLGADVEFPPGVAYYHDLYADPTWRSLGTGTALVSHQLHALAAAGYTKIHGAVVPENHPSIRVCLKLGYLPVEWLVGLSFGRWRRVFRRPWRGAIESLERSTAHAQRRPGRDRHESVDRP